MENDSFTKNKLELTSYKQQPLDCIITYVMSWDVVTQAS